MIPNERLIHVAEASLPLGLEVRAKAYAKTITASVNVRISSVAIRPLSGGYAHYNPILNRIVIDRDIAEVLPDNQLRALIAHEVGHAQQRKVIWKDGLRYLFPPLGVLSMFGITAVVIFTKTHNALIVIGLLVASLALTVLCDRLLSPLWISSYQLREFEANEFADSIFGDGSMAETIETCKRIRSEN